MRLSYWIVIVVSTLWIGVTSCAQEAPVGWSAVAQFRSGIGARALAMGSAYTALAEGPTAVFWNAAGLPVAELGVEGMHVEPLGVGFGYRLQFLGAAGRFMQHLGWGLGWLNAHVGGIPNTETGGMFDYDSSVFFGGLGVEESISSVIFRVGLMAKIYREQMLEGQAHGVGWDLGVTAVLDNWSIAYCGQDVGSTRYRWHGTGQEPLVVVPWVHRVGVAAHWLDNMLITTADVVIENNTSPSFRLGIEWNLLDVLAVRGGLRVEPLQSDYRFVWTLGLGIGPWKGFVIDYGFLENPLPAAGVSPNTHVFSVDFAF